MSIDEQIKALGYEEHVRDISCCYIVYENKEEDTEVTSNGVMMTSIA